MRSPTSSHTAARSSSGLIVGSTVFFGKRPMLRRLVGKVFAVFHQSLPAQMLGMDGPRRRRPFGQYAQDSPSFGENQTDESASNRENPPGPPIRTVPFV